MFIYRVTIADAGAATVTNSMDDIVALLVVAVAIVTMLTRYLHQMIKFVW